MKHLNQTRPANHSEEGYLLVWVMFLLAVFTIWLSVAVPRAAKEIQRDRELETMQRGKQYARAIQLYYKKFRNYPPNADALVNTNQIRFLRKKYIDPITRKDDWKPIRFGQAKTQTLGFFGQPIAGTGSAGGTVMAGIGPSGNGGLGGSSAGGPSTNSGFGGSSLFPPSTPSPTGSSPAPGTSSPTSGTGTTGTSTPSGTDSSGSSSGSSGSASGSSGSSTGSSAFGSSGQTFGGAGIIGFAPASSQASILIYKKKQHYNEWEFIYDPLLDMRTVSGNTGTVGQPASGTSSPIGNSPGPGFGSGSGPGFGSGSGPGFGSGSGPGFGSGTGPVSIPGTGASPPQSPPQQ